MIASIIGALWNEQDIGYWNPWGNPEQYGNLLAPFVQTVHQTDPLAKVIYGGQAGPSREFTQRALDSCKCASGNLEIAAEIRILCSRDHGSTFDK